MSKKSVVLIGYSGHAFVVCDALLSQGIELAGYCEQHPKTQNPYRLPHWGDERDENTRRRLAQQDYFVAIGANDLRQQITQKIAQSIAKQPIAAIHARAYCSPTAVVSAGALVGAGACINACSSLGLGVICNTGCIVEHECIIEDFAHIAPSAVLCGNVFVGQKAFVGANAVIKQGVRIGEGAIIGAGTVVIRDVPPYTTVVGNPQRIVNK